MIRDIEGFIRELTEGALGASPESHSPALEPLESVLKGQAVELWCNLVSETLFLVADEADAARLGEPKGQIYTGAEVRKVITITDRDVIKEIHGYKRRLNGTLREVNKNRTSAASQGTPPDGPAGDDIEKGSPVCSRVRDGGEMCP